MPATLQVITEEIENRARKFGQRLRQRRKELKVSATAAAEAAGMSRVTWYRLEKGATSVTLGAWLSAVQALGLEVSLDLPAGKTASAHAPASGNWIPARIRLADYPQLRQLAWQLPGIEELSPREALGIYERNWRHLDLNALEPREQALVRALRLAFNEEGSDV